MTPSSNSQPPQSTLSKILNTTGAAVLSAVLISGAGVVPAEAAPLLFMGVEPEQKQIPSSSSPESELPQIPAPQLPKSTLPEMPKFSMPEKAPVEPPQTRMNIPRDVPKTESPAIPVPPPSGGINESNTNGQGLGLANWFQGGKSQTLEPAKQEVSAAVKQVAAAPAKEAAKRVETEAEKRLARRSGAPLFLVQFLLTAGLGAAVAGFVLKFDTVMEGGKQTEAFIIDAAEKLENSSKTVPDAKKPESSSKTASDAAKAESSSKTAPDAEKLESTSKAVPAAEKSESSSKAVPDAEAKKSD